MNHELAHVLGGSRWLIEPSAFRALVKRAEMATPQMIEAAIAAYGQRDTGPKMIGDVAVIDVCGPITYKSSWWSMFFGGGAIQDLQQQFRTALNDPAVRMIAFRFDSPGGVVDMVQEFGEEIFAARGQKPLIAIADTMIASAAYWIAAQVDTIYASASSQLGSIGVFCEHDDISGMLEKAGVKVTLVAHGDHKVDANPYEPLSDAARADLQAAVDQIGDAFETGVARGRGVKKSVVLETFGQGKVFRGKEAIALGLADKAGTVSQVLAKLTKGKVGVASARAEVAAQTPAPVIVTQPIPISARADDDDDSGCDVCAPDCPCEEDECPQDCSTCVPECACRMAAKKAAATAADEEAAILASRADY